MVSEGASDTWWLCDGLQLRRLGDTEVPGSLQHHKTFSMYYSDGKGFVVLKGDATDPDPDEVWLPLCFEHDQSDNYSSYLTNAKEHPALYCWRADQRWVRLLLPDVYHGSNTVQQPYGALKGDLPIFLALVAFSMPVDQVKTSLPFMFHSGRWQAHNMTHGRENPFPHYTHSPD